MSAIFPTNIERNKDLLLYLTSTGIDFDENSTRRPTGFFDYQLLMTVEGIGQFETNKTKFLLKPNSIVFLPANTPHAYHKISTSWKTHWLSYNGTSLEDFHRSIGLNSITLIHEDDPDKEFFKSQLEFIYQLTNADYRNESLHISTCIYQLIFHLTKSQQHHKKSLKASKEDYIQQMIDYIDLHYMECLTIEELSSYINISSQYLCKLFQNKLGLRPFEYIKQVRISKSKTFLIQTSLPVHEIAQQVGFNNASYFGSLFKSQELKTPRQFRETYKRGD